MKSIISIFTKHRSIGATARHRYHKAMHSGHTLMHCLYLTAVGIEAHGFYGKAAFGLLAIIVVGIFTGESDAV